MTKGEISFETTVQISTSLVLNGDKGSRFQNLPARGPGKFISPRLTTPKVLKKRSFLENRAMSLCFTCFLNFESARSPSAEYDDFGSRSFDTYRDNRLLGVHAFSFCDCISLLGGVHLPLISKFRRAWTIVCQWSRVLCVCCHPHRRSAWCDGPIYVDGSFLWTKNVDFFPRKTIFKEIHFVRRPACAT